MNPGETGAKNRESGKNLKLSLRGSVEIQTQHWPDWFHKVRTKSVRLDLCVNRVRQPVRKAGAHTRGQIGA